MKRNYFFIVIMIVCNICITDALAGNFMRERDEYFQGARQAGMAGIGFSMPDDENVMFLNPAGLGIKSRKFERMAVAYGNMFEFTVQNTFLTQDHYIPIRFQSSKDKSVNGFGIQLESFLLKARGDGIQETIFDPYTGTIVPTGNLLKDKHLLNMWIVSYGKNLSFWNAEKHAFGISLTMRSMYETNFGNPVTELSLLADAGYTGSFENGIHLGLAGKNIPVVRSFDRDNQQVNIPVCIVPAFGWYKDIVKESERTMVSLFTEIQYKISIEKFRDYSPDFADGTKVNRYNKSHFFSGGFELGLAENIFIRNGYRLNFGDDFSFNKIEFANGLGFNNQEINIFNFYFSFYVGEAGFLDQKRFGCSASFFI